jgi:hypothetical protein
MRWSKSSSTAKRSMFTLVACAQKGVREGRQDRNELLRLAHSVMFALPRRYKYRIAIPNDVFPYSFPGTTSDRRDRPDRISRPSSINTAGTSSLQASFS